MGPQFGDYWYWNDGARLTGTEATRLRATLDPRPQADRPRGAATGPRGGDPSAHAADLISANLVHHGAPWRAIRGQNGMCITHDCQFEAQVLVNGNAHCCFTCHTARAIAHARDPTVRLAPTAATAAQSAATHASATGRRTPTGAHSTTNRSTYPSSGERRPCSSPAMPALRSRTPWRAPSSTPPSTSASRPT